MEGCAEVGECVLNRDVWTKTFKNIEKLLHKSEKEECGNLSNSEERIFHSVRELKKDFLKGIRKKEF